MARSPGVSGLAVAMATTGAVLVYLGVKGIPVREGLRSFAGGSLPTTQGAHGGGAVDAAAAQLGGGSSGTADGGSAGAGAVGAGPHPEFARAALARQGEKYSQARRWDQGYSDCSSFVGKVLKDNGITPPGASVTGSYLVWSKLRRIKRADVGAGDLLCGPGHIAIALSNTQAIGQQNSRTSVRIGTIESIMSGQASWFPQRYVG